MKKLALGLLLLGCLKHLVTSDSQAEALYETKMYLKDVGGVLNDWKDNQMTPCNWSHVICRDGKVTTITLSSTGLAGTLSASIAKLTALQELFLDGNGITDNIPEELGNLSSLITLNLGRNVFSGSIPKSLGHLQKLQSLDLSENLLSGEIPSSLSNLSSLNEINLQDNNLEGEIPEQLFQVARYNYTGNHLNCSHSQYSTTPCQKGTTNTEHKGKSIIWVLAVVSSVLAIICCLLFWHGLISRRRLRKGKWSVMHLPRMNVHQDEEIAWGIEGNNPEFKFFDLPQVLEATDNFSVDNKLGQGGFGPVYKGRLPDGSEIAVKRLASHSAQGFIEFRNEVQTIAKLQHRNLVRLLGCCSQGEEKMLVYEYLQNKSLDFFIFDEDRRRLLHWDRRLVIIEGIAQGLLYLHKHSRLRVIHRDVKASNILLDSDESKKSDFGIAKMFSSNDIEGNTSRVIGTYGYMAPEYASEGFFSAKSDVYSFGVLILEIIIGERNYGFHQSKEFPNLLGYAWQLWNQQRWYELIDASVAVSGCTIDMMRCINIALLCVQENATDRPTMSDVVAMLGSESMALPEPTHPGYFHVRVAREEASTIAESCSAASTIAESYSANDVTMSLPYGR